MTNDIRPDEAARALTEIARRRAQVVTAAIVPTWFWWAVAVLMVGFTVAVETRRPVVIGIATATLVGGVLAAAGRLVYCALRRAQPRNDLLRPSGVVAIVGFTLGILAVSLPTSIGLKAAGFRYPATVGIALAGAFMVVGGPLLMRYLRRVMLADRESNREGGRA